MTKYLYILLFLLVSLSVSAQDTSRKERIQALKVAFMTDRISLSAKEAQQFWPAYNDFEKSIDEIIKEERKTYIFINENIETMDDSTAKKALDDLEEYEEKKVKAREKLLNKLRNVFSYKKTLIFIKAEGDFKRNLLKTLRSNRRGN